MSYRVFTDFHHGALLQSLILLFEKRLGGQVFRPIGLEWFTEGYWKINNQQDTAEQFLGMHTVPKDGTPPLNNIEQTINDDIYLVQDTIDGTNKAITLSTFLSTPIDLVIASIPAHIEPFKKLCELHPSKPKLIYQIGNQWNVDPSIVKNVMASATVDIPPGINGVVYHQEFDTEIFRPSRIITNQFNVDADYLEAPMQTVYSFINILQNHRDWSTFLACEKLLEGQFEFRSFGGQCRDGNMNGARELAAKMRESRFVWHTKQGGDGYGHILHNAFAVARPVIIRREDYWGKLGDKLLVDGFSAIFIDGLSPEQIVEKINYYSEPGRYTVMLQSVYAAFRQVVNFDLEEMKIREFLGKLQ
jgi:hypothetical protein